MGFFSWCTADRNESIANSYSTRRTKTVYLIQPAGEKPIREDAYEGYGKFGGIDAYTWLARANRNMIKRSDDEFNALTEDDLNAIGITIGVGSYYRDTADGSLHTIFSAGPHLIDPEVMMHPCTYGQPIEHFGGKTGNELIKEGRLVEMGYHVEVPLKFSFNPDAVYEKLPASPECENQGYFYD